MNSEKSPLELFKKKIKEFASGTRRGIRNPFIILPVKPAIEFSVFKKMKDWDGPEDCPYDVFNAQSLMAESRSVQITNAFIEDSESEIPAGEIKENLSFNLAKEIARQLNDEITNPHTRRQIVLIGNLGSIYPFASASEILDQVERINIKSTIGIIFPGPSTLSGSAVSFFGQKHTHYYPAHIIQEQMTPLSGETL